MRLNWYAAVGMWSTRAAPNMSRVTGSKKRAESGRIFSTTCSWARKAANNQKDPALARDLRATGLRRLPLPRRRLGIARSGLAGPRWRLARSTGRRAGRARLRHQKWICGEGLGLAAGNRRLALLGQAGPQHPAAVCHSGRESRQPGHAHPGVRLAALAEGPDPDVPASCQHDQRVWPSRSARSGLRLQRLRHSALSANAVRQGVSRGARKGG